MKGPLDARTRKLTVIAQDPTIKSGGRILTTQLDVPDEPLLPGPCGYRVHVIDYDASTGVHYKPKDKGLDRDPFEKATSDELVGNPHFHAQNVYAIAMRTLGRFELALGRRVSWSFYGHQLKIAPHAFADANAFYSEQDQSLMFGYFPARKRGQTVFTCLSHDVVAHETTHALIDGLRTRYTDPSSPDQTAFHEGFADVVALLSVFSQPEVVSFALKNLNGSARNGDLFDKLKDTALLAVGEQFGAELSHVRGQPLRRSVALEPDPKLTRDKEFLEPHRRGELLVAAMLRAFVGLWVERATEGGKVAPDLLRLCEEGTKAAEHLLTIAIRAIDYTPPVDLQFGDFLSALLTADAELWPDDSNHHYRDLLRGSFASFGIKPASGIGSSEPGVWDAPHGAMAYDSNHFDSLQRAPDEVFRFIWENRRLLKLREGAYTRVLSVRPAVRVGTDGFVLRETVSEYVQMMKLRGDELKLLKLRRPTGVSASDEVTLYGGGALIFDEFGRLKYHVHNRVASQRQQARLDYLGRGAVTGSANARPFAALHRGRMLGRSVSFAEGW